MDAHWVGNTLSKVRLALVVHTIQNTEEETKMSRFLKFLGRLIAKLAGLPDVIAKWRQAIPIDKVMAYVAEAETISNLSVRIAS